MAAQSPASSPRRPTTTPTGATARSLRFPAPGLSLRRDEPARPGPAPAPRPDRPLAAPLRRLLGRRLPRPRGSLLPACQPGAHQLAQLGPGLAGHPDLDRPLPGRPPAALRNRWAAGEPLPQPGAAGVAGGRRDRGP